MDRRLTKKEELLTFRDPLGDGDDGDEDGALELLRELDDKKLFPGYEFTSKDKFKARSIASIQQNILIHEHREHTALDLNLNLNLNLKEEQEILDKHTIYGSISTFKGREEMRQFKETLAVKKLMLELNTKIANQEAMVDYTKEKLLHYTDQSSRAKKELEKIETEVAELLMKHSYKPKIKDHELNLPDDIKMLSQSRFRLLVEHHGLHRGLYDEAEGKIPVYSAKLQKERQGLEETIAKESALNPIIQEVKKRDIQAFEELHIVSKHRHIAYEKKKNALYAMWEEKERAELERRENQQRARLEMTTYLDSKNERMQAFLKESTEKKKLAESLAESTPKTINDRKLRALDALALHLKSIKAGLLKKRTVSNRREPVVEEGSINSIKKKIAAKFKALQMKAILKKEATEEKKKKIVEKVLRQEYHQSAKPFPKVAKKRVQFEKDSTNDHEVTHSEDTKQGGSEIHAASSQIAAVAESISFLDLERDPSPIPPAKQRALIPLVRAKPFRPPKKLGQTAPTKAPFEFDPAAVEFKDTVAHEKYFRQIRVINSTSSPKYFKFVNFSAGIADYAMVTMEPSKNMCSGAECFLKVEFTPTPELLSSQSTDTHFLTFQSSCGTFMQVPLKFSVAKCAPLISSVGGPTILTNEFLKSPQYMSDKRKESAQIAPLNSILLSKNHLKINFEECVMGDKRKMWIKMVNDGSISTAFYVEPKEALQYSPSTSILTSGLEESSEEIFSEGPFVVSQAAGQLGSYGSKTIVFSFEPIYDADKIQTDFGDTKVTAIFNVKFEHQSEPFLIECHASTRALTLYPERQAIDFKTCLPGIHYQDKVHLWNRHKISRKFWVNAGNYASVSHADTKVTTIPGIATIEFCPSIGFIQPNSSCTVWIKIKFHREALEKLKGSEGTFCETIRFGYLEQATAMERFAPIFLRALVTDSQVSVVAEVGNEPSLLRFGRLSVYERKNLGVKVINTSKFSQMVQYSETDAFKLVPLAGDISDRVFKIAPETTIRRFICFEPSNTQQYNERISFKTTWNQEIGIRCQGEGYCPPAHFNNSLISFQSIPFGNEDVKRVLLERNGKMAGGATGDLSYVFKKPILLSISSHDQLPSDTLNDLSGTPEENGILKLSERDTDMLHIWPKSGVLSRNQKVSVEVLASIPPRSTNGVAQPYWKRLKADVEMSSTGNLVKAEKQSKEKEVKDPKIRKERSGASAKPKREETKLAKEGSASSGIENQDSIVLEMTPYQKALLNTSKPVASWLIPCRLTSVDTEEERLKKVLKGDTGVIFSDFNNENSSMIYLKVIVPIIESKLSLISPENGSIEFPILAVGKKASKKVVIQNSSPLPVQLSVVGFSPHGPFYLSKALRSIPGNEKVELLVNFKPEFQAKFCDIAEFSAGLCKIPIRLVGEGVAPDLKISHPDIVELGNVCVGDTETHEFEITNPSKVPVAMFFSLASTSAPHHFSLNHSKKSPFMINMYRATLASGDSLKLLLTFAPDREHDNFYDFICIKHDGQAATMQIKVKGKGWEISPIVLGYNDHPDTFLASRYLQSPREEYDWVATKVYNSTPLAGGGSDVSGGGGGGGGGGGKATKGKEIAPVTDFLVASSKRIGHFVTIPLEWKQVPGTELVAAGYVALDPQGLYWRIEGKPIEIANLKPVVKGAEGKKSVEYSVEKMEGSFEYDPETNDYFFTPPCAADSYNCGFALSLEPGKGSVESGSTKQLDLLIRDPSRLILHKAFKTWDRLDSQPIQAPATRFKKSSARPESLLTVCMARDEEWELGHPTQAQEFKKMALAQEVVEPVRVEQVFKIVFKNGVRFVDPKGVQAPEESRVFYVKVVTVTNRK